MNRDTIYRNEYNFVQWKFGLAKINSHNVLPTPIFISHYKSLNWNFITFQSHMRGIRQHNYKELCLICGLEDKNEHICDVKNTNLRERLNIFK